MLRRYYLCFIFLILVIPNLAAANSWHWNEWTSGSADWGLENAWIDENGDVGNAPNIGSDLYFNRASEAGTSGVQTIQVRNNFNDAVKIDPTGATVSSGGMSHDEIHVNALGSGSDVNILHNNYGMDIGKLHLGDLANQNGKAIYTYTSDGEDAGVILPVATYTVVTDSEGVALDRGAQVTYANETSFVFDRNVDNPDGENIDGVNVKFLNDTTVTFYDGSTQTYLAGTTVDFGNYQMITFPAGTSVEYPGFSMTLGGVSHDYGAQFAIVKSTGTETAYGSTQKSLSVHTAFVGETSQGELNIKDGNANNISLQQISIGQNQGAQGVVNLKNTQLGETIFSTEGTIDTTVTMLDYIDVGHGGKGELNQSGGSVSVSSLTVGATGEGKFVLADNGLLYAANYASIGALGSITSGGLTPPVTGYSKGNFIQQDGRFLVGNNLFVGQYGQGSFELNGGQVVTHNNLFVGLGGRGSFVQSGGEVAVGGQFYSTGMDPYGILYVGKEFGSNIGWEQDGDGVYYNLYQAAGVGKYYLEDGVLSASEEHIGSTGNVGYGGVGKFIQTGGVNNIEQQLKVGPGNYFLDRSSYQLDGGIVNSSEVTVIQGSSSFIQNGGTHNVGVGSLHQFAGLHLGISDSVSTSTTYELNGGVLNSNNIYLKGDFYQRGGENNVLDTIYLKSDYGSYFSEYHLENGDLNSKYLTIQDNSYFSQTGGNHNNTGTITLENGNVDNGYYALSGGTLNATHIVDQTDNKNSFHFTGGSLSVDNFEGNLNMEGGVLAPGHSPGETRINGNFTMTGGLLDFEIASVTDFDFMTITGNAEFDTNGTLQFSFLDNFIPESGDTFRFMTASSFANFDLFPIDVLGLGPNLSWEILAGVDTETSMNYRTLSFLSANESGGPVPEPATILLFGIGLVGLVTSRIIKKKQQ